MRCYEIAPPRVQQYLDAEIEHVMDRIEPGGIVLELGCGYGRVLKRLAEKAEMSVGIDTSSASLEFGKNYLEGFPNCILFQMDAVRLAFSDGFFDAVVCIQNGLSAFKVEQKDLIRESIRVTRPGGLSIFSSYSDKFWQYRLEWFELQAGEGLLGEIDYEATGEGVIVCKDGFRATTLGPDDFRVLTSPLGIEPEITEVDRSSVFCAISVE